MEQNNQNEASEPAENQPISQQQEPVSVAVVVEAEQAPASPRRKNGRNSRAGGSPAAKSGAQSLNCGEISDISTASEKLSGSNINGYSKKRHDKIRDQRNPENGENQNPDLDASAEALPEHDGPSFEQNKFTPRTIEVPLEDRRPKNFGERKIDDGVVSYSTADEAACSVSLFARIKSALKSIFGGRKSKKSDKRKFDKNFKKDFKGKKKFHNSKHFNKDGKNYNRRHQNRGNRRPQQNGAKDAR